jgi:hypothetical protein
MARYDHLLASHAGTGRRNGRGGPVFSADAPAIGAGAGAIISDDRTEIGFRG